MSPIFVRPVREQLEHDRLIRFLQAKYKKKQLEVAVNVGDERLNPVKIGLGTFFPDLVMTAGKKLSGLVEVETGESVNNLEAMAQWVHFSRARVPFHLYVPVTGYDTARRLCDGQRCAAVGDLDVSGHDGRVRSRPHFPRRRSRYREASREASAGREAQSETSSHRGKEASSRRRPRPRKRKPRRPKPPKAKAKKPAKAAAKPARKR